MKGIAIIVAILALFTLTFTIPTTAVATEGDTIIGIISLFGKLIPGGKNDNKPEDILPDYYKQRVIAEASTRNNDKLEFGDIDRIVVIDDNKLVFAYNGKCNGNKVAILFPAKCPEADYTNCHVLGWWAVHYKDYKNSANKGEDNLRKDMTEFFATTFSSAP